MSFLITNTVGTSLAPAPLRKTSSLPLYLGSVRGRKDPRTYTLGRGCGRGCVVWSVGPAAGLGPIPVAAAPAVPVGVAAWRGGGGRGGFSVWREKEKERTDDLFTSLPVSGREKESETH